MVCGEFGRVCERRKFRVNVGKSNVMRCYKYGVYIYITLLGWIVYIYIHNNFIRVDTHVISHHKRMVHDYLSHYNIFLCILRSYLPVGLGHLGPKKSHYQKILGLNVTENLDEGVKCEILNSLKTLFKK